MKSWQELAARTAAISIVGVSVAVGAGCGAGDLESEQRQVGALEAAGGAGSGGSSAGSGGSSAGGSSADSSSAQSSSSTSSSSSSSSSSGPGSTSSGGSDCSIMSSNTACAECLATNCCMVINACMDEAYLSCVGCIDSFLSGDGDTDCDTTVGKNDWVVECVSFNCVDECAEG